MKRHLLYQLVEWKNSKNRKPLIIQGARQVGKTWLMKEFGQKEFNWEKFGETLCDNSKCKLINTFPYFKDYVTQNINWSKDLYFVNDEHFNKNGNMIIANVLEYNLMKKNQGN